MENKRKSVRMDAADLLRPEFTESLSISPVKPQYGLR